MKKILLALLICAMASAAFAADLSALEGKVGVSGQQESSILLTNFDLQLAYPVTVGDMNFRVIGDTRFWNGGGLQGMVASVTLEASLGSNAKIYVTHNEGTDFYRGSLGSSNVLGAYIPF